MKAQLIKKNDGWYNLYQGNIGIGSTYSELQGHKLSLKNCQAIERGYDLDELAYSCFPNGTYETSEIDLGLDMYKKGFQKALELLGDNKYSEEDIKEAYLSGVDDAMDIQYEPNATIDDEKYLKSLQQTEWDVEIEMVPAMSNNGNVYYGDIPKLDADGCLILKRI
jgi:hypothetical protein